MSIKHGDRLPDAAFVIMGAEGPEVRTTDEIFAGHRVALFGLPGAYTPVCHAEHMPGIVALHKNLRQHGVDIVACTSVNDIFVMDRWARELGATESVLMLADGNADFALRAGLAIDLTRFGLGFRSNRYAMLVTDGVVRMIDVEEVVTQHERSSAAAVCRKMEHMSEYAI